MQKWRSRDDGCTLGSEHAYDAVSPESIAEVLRLGLAIGLHFRQVGVRAGSFRAFRRVEDRSINDLFVDDDGTNRSCCLTRCNEECGPGGPDRSRSLRSKPGCRVDSFRARFRRTGELIVELTHEEVIECDNGDAPIVVIVTRKQSHERDNKSRAQGPATWRDSPGLCVGMAVAADAGVLVESAVIRLVSGRSSAPRMVWIMEAASIDLLAQVEM